MANNTSVLDVIRNHHITNAQELTAFFLGDESKGILTPYQDGYGEQLWDMYLKELRGFYDCVLKKKVSKKQNKRNKRNNNQPIKK